MNLNVYETDIDKLQIHHLESGLYDDVLNGNCHGIVESRDLQTARPFTSADIASGACLNSKYDTSIKTDVGIFDNVGHSIQKSSSSKCRFLTGLFIFGKQFDPDHPVVVRE